MDAFLRSETFDCSIDEIYIDKRNQFAAVLIPDIQSKYFPPYHLRTIRFPAMYLEEKFYQSMYLDENFPTDFEFTGGVKQGGFYRLPSEYLHLKKAFQHETVIDEDIFSKTIGNSPHSDEINGKISIDRDIIESSLSEKNNKQYENIHLYGFNVGQGDSLLLITSNGNPYLIDTNIYSKESEDLFIDKIQSILKKHGLQNNRIKGLIVTHKHRDHLRGLYKIIDSNRLKFDYFFINKNYKHPTIIVSQMLSSARNKIDQWINVNHSFTIHDGNTILYFVNPDNKTSSNKGTPDINDSSISICVHYGNCSIVLTGDTSFKILNNKHLSKPCRVNLLKVSHHGSATGTNQVLLKTLNPEFAFISAGNSKKYNHPNTSVINLFKNHSRPVNWCVSKFVRSDAHYTISKNNIVLRLI